MVFPHGKNMLMLLWLLTVVERNESSCRGKHLTPLGGKGALQKIGCKSRATPLKKTCAEVLVLICRNNFRSLKKPLCSIHNLVSLAVLHTASVSATRLSHGSLDYPRARTAVAAVSPSAAGPVGESLPCSISGMAH